jgi:hypothetical protein
MILYKLNFFKVRWGIFSFFSSTNVETKNFCPIAYNINICESYLVSVEFQRNGEQKQSTSLTENSHFKYFLTIG